MLHCRGCTPGLLTVITCAGGSAPPSMVLKERTAGESCSTASCPGCSGVTFIFTSRVSRPASDTKIIEAAYDPALRFARSAATTIFASWLPAKMPLLGLSSSHGWAAEVGERNWLHAIGGLVTGTEINSIR